MYTINSLYNTYAIYTIYNIYNIGPLKRLIGSLIFFYIVLLPPFTKKCQHFFVPVTLFEKKALTFLTSITKTEASVIILLLLVVVVLLLLLSDCCCLVLVLLNFF